MRGCTKLPLDLFMTASFLSSLMFFINLKREKKGEELSRWNKAVICGTIVLALLELINCIITTVCFTMFKLSYFKDSPETLHLLRIFIQPIS